jgi:integrase
MTRRKYVHSFIDDRYGKAKARYYFRRRGHKQVPLPGMPGSIEFEQAYAAAIANEPLPSTIGAKRIRVGTIDALVIAYFNSPMFLGLASATQATYRGILEAFTREHGAKPLALLTRKHLEAMLARKMKTPAAGNHWLRLIKTLMRFAVREQLRADDPARDIDYIKRKVAGFHTWSEPEIAQFEAHHPIGSKARLALALGLYSGQRRGDCIRMGRQHVRNGLLHVKQRKTGWSGAIPVHANLQAALATVPSTQLTFLINGQGKPFTGKDFTQWFARQCAAAGLPQHCVFHGLRKAALTRLADAGCTVHQIAAISGHKSLREVERYTRGADQERLARDAMARTMAADIVTGAITKSSAR